MKRRPLGGDHRAAVVLPACVLRPDPGNFAERHLPGDRRRGFMSIAVRVPQGGVTAGNPSGSVKRI